MDSLVALCVMRFVVCMHCRQGPQANPQVLAGVPSPSGALTPLPSLEWAALEPHQTLHALWQASTEPVSISLCTRASTADTILCGSAEAHHRNQVLLQAWSASQWSPWVQVWAHPTTSMQCDWLGERVATVDINRAINNVIVNKEDAGWGPNAVFRFPLEGGTGAIWKGVAKLLPQDKQVCRPCCACMAAGFRRRAAPPPAAVAAAAPAATSNKRGASSAQSACS